MLDVFDKVTDNMEAMKEIHLNSDEQHLFGRAALMVRYEDENKTPVTPEQIITPRRREDKQNDLWTTWQRVQENMIKVDYREKVPPVKIQGQEPLQALMVTSESTKHYG